MNYNVESVGATKKKLSIEVPLETVKAEYEKVLNVVRRQARLKGFRAGKVPVSMVKKLFGPQIEQEVTQKLMEESLPKALEESGEEMISQPVIDESEFDADQAFRYSVSFEVRPEFEISGYTGLDLEREIINVSEDMVEQRLESLRQAYATTESIEEERPVQDQDLAVIDYKAFIDGEPLEGGANPNYQLEVGSGRFHPDFEAALIGMSKDQEKGIVVNFDEDHFNPKLAGKEVRFEVKIVDIKVKVLPDLDDDFAKDLGEEIDSMETLRTKIREDITANEEKRVQEQMENQLKDKLVELVDIEAPESLTSQEIEAMVSNTMFNLRRSGLTLEAMGMSEAKLRDDFRPEAEKRVKVALILQKIAANEGLEATEEDLENAFMEIARDTGNTPEAIKEIYNKNNMIDTLSGEKLAEKTLKYLIGGATIKDVEPAAPAEEDQAESNEDGGREE